MKQISKSKVKKINSKKKLHRNSDISNVDLGRIGERLACKYLKNKGFNIVTSNYYKRVGEIDIIALKDNIIHFVEVKSVSRETYFDPHYETSLIFRPEVRVSLDKMFHMKQAINLFVAEYELFDHLIQVDIVTVTFYLNRSQPTINFIGNIQLS